MLVADKNNMFGALEFSEACLKKGIKPIFGMEASVKIQEEIYPFLLLAKDDIGYFDLVKINCDINIHEERCIDLKRLSSYQKHLYVMSASMEGIIERLVAKEMEEEAIKYLKLKIDNNDKKRKDKKYYSAFRLIVGCLVILGMIYLIDTIMMTILRGEPSTITKDIVEIVKTLLFTLSGYLFAKRENSE